MTKIYNIKSKIEDLKTIIDKSITIWVFNSFDSSFIHFLGIVSHKTREKNKLSILEKLTKFLKNKELWIKNQNNAIANYTKQFTKKKKKLLLLKLKTLRILKLAFP